MRSSLANILHTSLATVLLGLFLTGCPAAFAPTGAFNANPDAAPGTSSDAKDADASVDGLPTPAGDLAPGGSPSGGSELPFSNENKLPISGSAEGPIVNLPVSGPGSDTANPVVADAGGITARPDEASIGIRPFVASSSRCWTGSGLNTLVPEGGTVPAAMSKTRTIDLAVLAEYFPIQSNLAQVYPSGMQIRLIWMPANGNPMQIKHYDTLVLESEPGVRAANVVIDDLPVEEGVIRVYAYEAARRDAEANLILIRTEDFSENEWVKFPTPFKAMAFFNDPFTRLLFTVDVHPIFQQPAIPH